MRKGWMDVDEWLWSGRSEKSSSCTQRGKTDGPILTVVGRGSDRSG